MGSQAWRFRREDGSRGGRGWGMGRGMALSGEVSAGGRPLVSDILGIVFY